MVGRVGPHPTNDLLTLLTQLPGTHQFFFFSRNVAVAVYHKRCSKEYIPGKFLAKRLCHWGGLVDLFPGLCHYLCWVCICCFTWMSKSC